MLASSLSKKALVGIHNQEPCIRWGLLPKSINFNQPRPMALDLRQRVKLVAAGGGVKGRCRAWNVQQKGFKTKRQWGKSKDEKEEVSVFFEFAMGFRKLEQILECNKENQTLVSKLLNNQSTSLQFFLGGRAKFLESQHLGISSIPKCRLSQWFSHHDRWLVDLG